MQNLSAIHAGCKDGDVLNISIERDQEATQHAKERVSGLMEKLKKNKGETGIIHDPEG